MCVLSSVIKRMFVLLIFFSIAEAAATPDWIKKPPVEDNKYRFYVGRASGKKTDSQRALIKVATEDAREQAISENFGILTSISKESYQTTKSSSTVSRVSESSDRVRLKKFRKKDQYIESKDGKQNIWLLFQYPKHEIHLETQRLDQIDSSKDQLDFSEMNATKSSKGGLS